MVTWAFPLWSRAWKPRALGLPLVTVSKTMHNSHWRANTFGAWVSQDCISSAKIMCIIKNVLTLDFRIRIQSIRLCFIYCLYYRRRYLWIHNSIVTKKYIIVKRCSVIQREWLLFDSNMQPAEVARSVQGFHLAPVLVIQRECLLFDSNLQPAEVARSVQGFLLPLVLQRQLGHVRGVYVRRLPRQRQQIRDRGGM